MRLEEPPLKCSGSPYGSVTGTGKRISAEADEDRTRSLILLDRTRELTVCIAAYATVHANEKASSNHTTYQVVVKSCREGRHQVKWVVYRRYSAFLSLVYRLTKAYNYFAAKLAELPPKSVSLTGDRFIQSRAKALDKWISGAVYTWCTQAAKRETVVHQIFVDFLVDGADRSPLGPADTLVPLANDVSQLIVNESQNCDPNMSPRTSAAMTLTRRKSQEVVGSPHAMTQQVSLSDFTILKVVGKGSFGSVFLAVNRNSETPCKPYAIKSLGKAEMIRRKQAPRVDTERACLAMAHSEFIVDLEYSFATETHLFLVQSYCPGGEMYFHLEQQGKFSSKLSRFYAAECALALDHLHKKGIIYRDLKPENIMINYDGHVKLVDFGLAKRNVFDACTGAKSFVGTAEYLSPEMLAKRGHGYAVDYWSLGMVLYEMLTGLPPWYCEDKRKGMTGITTEIVTFPENEVGSSARAIIQSLLEKNPRHRLGSKQGFTELERHPYFRAINFSKLAQKKIKPPFIPSIGTSTDTKYFDSMFTSLPANVPEISPQQKLKDDELIRYAESQGDFSEFVNVSN